MIVLVPNHVPLDVVDTGVDFDPSQDALEDDVTSRLYKCNRNRD